MQFGNIDAESVALFKNLLASLLNESIESVCEASHALTYVFEAKIDIR